MDTATEFMKLEKIELGGIKGKVLTHQVVMLFEEFNEKYKIFADIDYDCLDPTGTVSTYIHVYNIDLYIN